jgi:hypothetical protein
VPLRPANPKASRNTNSGMQFATSSAALRRSPGLADESWPPKRAWRSPSRAPGTTGAHHTNNTENTSNKDDNARKESSFQSRALGIHRAPLLLHMSRGRPFPAKKGERAVQQHPSRTLLLRRVASKTALLAASLAERVSRQLAGGRPNTHRSLLLRAAVPRKPVAQHLWTELRAHSVPSKNLPPKVGTIVVHKSLRRVAVTTVTLQNATRIAPHMRGRAATTERRRIRVAALVRQLPRHLLAPFLSGNFSATTALTYARTAAALDPALSADPTWRDALVFLRKAAADAGTRHAPVATAVDVAAIVRHSNPQTAAMALLLFLSASRHGDFVGRSAPERKLVGASLRMSWRTQKSDRFGERSLYKFVEAPLPVLDSLSRFKPPSYKTFLKCIREICPTLGAHSFRRGAATLLASRFEESEIVLLTGHSVPHSVSRSLRAYIEPHPDQRDPSRMRVMSSFLFGKVAEVLGATTLYVDPLALELSPMTPVRSPED